MGFSCSGILTCKATEGAIRVLQVASGSVRAAEASAGVHYPLVKHRTLTRGRRQF